MEMKNMSKKCELCEKELLSGLVAVGIKTCLQCRDQDAYNNMKNNTPTDDDNKIDIRNFYNRHEEGYSGTVGGYE
jgi:ribosomal protein L37AE/L43A